MKNTLTKGVSLAVLLTVGSVACKDSFLNVAPTGQLVGTLLNTKDGLEGLLISAYTQLNGRGFSEGSSPANWTVGSLMGGDANKGSDPADGSQHTPYVNYQINSNTSEVNARWLNMYEGVSRANSVLRTLPSAVPSVTDAIKQRVGAEARFLRGLYYFELKRAFNMVPYVDETVDYGAGIATIPNNVDIYSKIEADFKFAYDNLPETQPQTGRANKWAAAAYLARTYLYEKKYAEAKALFDLLIASGKTTNGKKYGLVPQYLQVFNAANENNEETIFSAQNVANAGSVDASSTDIRLNYPNGSPGPGCCGFAQPSFDLVNSFRTSATGLPLDLTLADGSYDTPANELKNDQGLNASRNEFVPDTRPVDPRLDLSVGRRGIPYLDWGPFSGNWIRNQPFGGPYAPKKYSYYLAQQSTVGDVSSWTKGWSSTNIVLLRYSDVLLMAAEAEVEIGSLATALSYVNLVRARAANPVNFVMGAATGTYSGKNTDGTIDYNTPILDNTKPAANYVIRPYTLADFDSKDKARSAVRFERKLELSGEGHRFFDLVRWGVAAPVLNAYLRYETTKLSNQFGGAVFTAGRNEYLPIPQAQIDLQGAAVLKQNPNY